MDALEAIVLLGSSGEKPLFRRLTNFKTNPEFLTDLDVYMQISAGFLLETEKNQYTS